MPRSARAAASKAHHHQPCRRGGGGDDDDDDDDDDDSDTLIHTAYIDHGLDPEREAQGRVEDLAAQHLVVVLPADVETQGGPGHHQPGLHVSEAVQEGGSSWLEFVLFVPGDVRGRVTSVAQALHIQRSAGHTNNLPAVITLSPLLPPLPPPLSPHVVRHPDGGVGGRVEDGEEDEVANEGVPQVEAAQVRGGRD